MLMPHRSSDFTDDGSGHRIPARREWDPDCSWRPFNTRGGETFPAMLLPWSRVDFEILAIVAVAAVMSAMVMMCFMAKMAVGRWLARVSERRDGR